MSTEPVAGKEFNALGADRLTFTAHPGRDTRLGGLPILRAMPIRDRRMTGPWCFLDRYGPLAFSADRAMDVPPHPHIGIQTVSWLLEGEVQHAESLGCEAVVRPGGVNVMTAGNGISHAEVTPSTNSGRLNGVQLWVALPDEQRMMAPSFAHIDQVPVVERRGGLIHVFAGSLGDTVSPAPHFSEIVGLDVQVHAGETTEFELNPAFEHAALLLEGECSFENQPLQPRVLYYFGTRRRSLALSSPSGARLLVIGGPPFPETVLMWWNFAARNGEEIRLAREDWEAARRGVETRFGQVTGGYGAMMAAPELAHFARPNPAS